jgi:hypothetical protein
MRRGGVLPGHELIVKGRESFFGVVHYGILVGATLRGCPECWPSTCLKNELIQNQEMRW